MRILPSPSAPNGAPESGGRQESDGAWGRACATARAGRVARSEVDPQRWRRGGEQWRMTGR